MLVNSTLWFEGSCFALMLNPLTHAMIIRLLTVAALVREALEVQRQRRVILWSDVELLRVARRIVKGLILRSQLLP